MKRSVAIALLLIAGPLAGAGLGRLAAPALARLHYTVQLSDQVTLAAQGAPGRADEKMVKAFQATGMPAAQLQAQGVGRPGVEAEVVGVAAAEAVVVDEHPHPRPLDDPGDELLDEARFVLAGDRPLGDRHPGACRSGPRIR